MTSGMLAPKLTTVLVILAVLATAGYVTHESQKLAQARPVARKAGNLSRYQQTLRQAEQMAECPH